MANSIGDLEAMCDEAPIQIGNYVWNDENEDGIQDPCESPIPGVLVSLYDGVSGNLLASTTVTAKTVNTTSPVSATSTKHGLQLPVATASRHSTRIKIVFGKNANLSQFNVTPANCCERREIPPHHSECGQAGTKTGTILTL
jgi:hypothetical protein